jgi:hypothetical protein
MKDWIADWGPIIAAFVVVAIVGLLLIGGVISSHRNDMELVSVTIVSIYETDRMGDDWVTVVEDDDRRRHRLDGKLGKVGDKLMVKRGYLK